MQENDTLRPSHDFNTFTVHDDYSRFRILLPKTNIVVRYVPGCSGVVSNELLEVNG